MKPAPSRSLTVALMLLFFATGCGLCDETATDASGEATEATEKKNSKVDSKKTTAKKDTRSKADASRRKKDKAASRRADDKKKAARKKADDKKAAKDLAAKKDAPESPKDDKKPGKGDEKKDDKKAPSKKDEMNFEQDETPKFGYALNKVLNRANIRTATGYRGLLRPDSLAGVKGTESYDAVRLKPTSPRKFGAALQLWAVSNPGEQTRRFNDLYRQYPDTKRTRDIGDSAFTAGWGGLKYMVWLDRKEKYLVALSCDEDICKDDDAILALARTVAEKIPESRE